MLFNMRPTLGALLQRRFSKTARSRPGQREAVRDRQHLRPLAVPGWCLAHDLVKGAAERARAGETDLEADLGDAEFGLPQQEHRALHAAALQVAMRRLAEGRPEAPDEV